jgi:hypothetical protein
MFFGTNGSLGIDRRGFRIQPDFDTPAANLIPGVSRGHPAGGPVAVPVDGPAKPRIAALEDLTGDSQRQYDRHARDFLDCVRTRRTPISDLASAQRTAVACHLANLSLRLGRSLRWDVLKKQVIGDNEANGMLTRPYRAPWDRELKALGVG